MYQKLSSSGSSSKYRSLIVSISMFSFLVVGIMFLSFYVSNQLEKDTKIINSAFDQTSLMNQVISELYIINSQFNGGEAFSIAQDRLQEAMELIDARIDAFDNGGGLPIVGLGLNKDLEILDIEAIDDPEAQAILEDVKKAWNEYKRRIEPIFVINARAKYSFAQRYQFYGSLLSSQGAINGLNRLRLHYQADRYAIYLQEKSNARLNLLRLAQVAGVIVTALSLFLILFFVMRQLRKTDIQLESAREETTGILSTIQEGLFLIHDDYSIGSEYSDELERVMGTDDIAGQNILQLLGGMISSSDIKNVESFIGSIFNPKVVEDLIMTLNPLREVNINIEDSDGRFHEKYLSFNFYRVMSGDTIRDVLVSVKDITDRVRLQEQLEMTKTENEQKVEMLVSIMNINPAVLRSFLKNCSSSLTDINAILKSDILDKIDFTNKIDDIFVRIHKVKGEASAIGLSDFAEKAHDFEDELQSLKSITQIKGMDFLSLTVQLNQLLSYTEKLVDLAAKMSSYDKHQQSGGASEVSPQQWQHLSKLVDDMQKHYGKKATFVMSGLSEISLDEDYQKIVNVLCVHLIKNSMVHGIESPEERRSMNKPEAGRVDLRAAKLNDGSVEIVVRDDGRGFDHELIAKKLVEKGHAEAGEVAQWPKEKVLRSVFTKGFSMADVDMHAGRGVGLNVINHSIQEAGGQLQVVQKTNQYCQFTVTLPPAAA